MDSLKEFKVLLLDADGVWFSGEEIRGVLPSGEVVIFKTRHYRDGQGLSFLRAIGIRVVFATGEGEPLGSIVKKLNELPSVCSGAWAPVECFVGKNAQGEKAAEIEAWLKTNNFTWSDCVYMGDDVNDLEPMKKAALAVCPADASKAVKSVAGMVSKADGGRGAVREFAEAVLAARGLDEAALAPA